MDCSCDGAGGTFGVLSTQSIDANILTSASTTREASLSTFAKMLLWMGLAVIAVTVTSFFAFVALRKSSRRFLIVNFELALFCSILSVLLGFDADHSSCDIWSELVLYFVLVTCSWLVINARVMYFSVWWQTNEVSGWIELKQAMVGWCMPALIVIVAALAGNTNSWSTHDDVCWPTGNVFWWGAVLPVVAGMVLVLGYTAAALRVVLYDRKVNTVTLTTASEPPRRVTHTSVRHPCVLCVLFRQLCVLCVLFLSILWSFRSTHGPC